MINVAENQKSYKKRRQNTFLENIDYNIITHTMRQHIGTEIISTIMLSNKMQ